MKRILTTLAVLGLVGYPLPAGGDCDSAGMVTKLTASDAKGGAQFGWSVAVGGETVVIGAPLAGESPDNGSSGSAYVFARSGDAWTEQAKSLSQ